MADNPDRNLMIFLIVVVVVVMGFVLMAGIAGLTP